MSKDMTPPVILLSLLLAMATLSAGPVCGGEPSDFLPRDSFNPLLRASDAPGVVGQARLRGRGPVVGYFQPVAIVRIGSLTPPSQESLLPEFFFGYPQWAPFPSATKPGVTPEPDNVPSEL